MLSTSTHRLRARAATAVIGTLAIIGATFVATPQSGFIAAANADEPDIVAYCDKDRTTNEFGGAEVSWAYGAYFNQHMYAGHFLEDYVPQGLGVWENWLGGPGVEDLLLVGMHHRDENANRSLLYGLTFDGRVRGAVTLPVGAHAGGVKVHKGWVYVQFDNRKILRYSVERVRKGFTEVGKSNLGWGEATNPVAGVSFFDIHGGYLYSGYHNPDGRGKMYRYAIQPDGNLVRDTLWGWREIPMKAQGVLVLKDTWIFSTSLTRYRRGNIYVVQNTYGQGAEFTSVGYRCFQSVAMTQELVGFNGTTYLLNESGAAAFADGRIHDIRHIHVANTASLRNLVWAPVPG